MPLDTPLASRDLARRLLAVEAAIAAPPGAHAHEAVRVCEKLRISLSRFAGPEGFTSLLRRSVALAGAEDPSLDGIRVGSHGCEGLEQVVGNGSDGTESAVAIVGHLLELLVTFLGEPITRRLVRHAWPDASFDEESRPS